MQCVQNGKGRRWLWGRFYRGIASVETDPPIGTKKRVSGAEHKQQRQRHGRSHLHQANDHSTLCQNGESMPLLLPLLLLGEIWYAVNRVNNQPPRGASRAAQQTERPFIFIMYYILVESIWAALEQYNTINTVYTCICIQLQISWHVRV